jgi:hypothetical protein
MPHARKTDPFTSHLAAESIKDVTPVQSRILSLFDAFGDMTDEELIRQYHLAFHMHWPSADSSIRSRRKELVNLGHLTPTSMVRNTKAGQKSIVWNRELVLI